MTSSTFKIIGLFLFFILLISTLVFGLFKLDGTANTFSEKDIKKIIANYIKENPETIIDSLTAYQQAEQDELNKKSKKTLSTIWDDIKNNPDAPIYGNPKGDVTILEFFDYSCGYCKKVFPYIMEIAKEDPNVKILFIELPILGKSSQLAAQAALATHILHPEKYIDIHRKLMKTRASSREAVLKLAEEIGLDKKTISEKMDSQQVTKILEDNKEIANSIGVRGTPAFVIDGKFIPGAVSYERLKELIKSARSSK